MEESSCDTSTNLKSMGKVWSQGLPDQQVNDPQESGNHHNITGLELNFQVAEGQPEGAHKATSPVIASPGLGLPRHQSGWELTRVSPEQKKMSYWGRETYPGQRAGSATNKQRGSR